MKFMKTMKYMFNEIFYSMVKVFHETRKPAEISAGYR